MEKILSLSRVKPGEMDTVKMARRSNDRRAFDVLFEAQLHYSAMHRFRSDRDRNKRYTYGDQWGDIIETDEGRMTEENYIKSQGGVPLKNNLIRRLVKNVMGVYRGQHTEPICTARDRDEQKTSETMTTILHCNMQMNRMAEVYARSFEEFLISGFVVHRKWYGWRNEKMDCWTDYVQPNNFFIDANMRDFRGWDCSLVGELHDVGFNELCAQFAKSPADYTRLRQIYSYATDRRSMVTQFAEFGFSELRDFDFFLTTDPTRCRVIEVWRKESKPRYRCHDLNSGDVFKVDVEDYDALVADVNASRLARGMAAGMDAQDIPLIKAEWFLDEYWYFYYLSPFGDILAEGETPYEHKSHPYVFKAYPFIDGEIHSFVSDVIDQQRYVNRLVMMHEWIMRSSAKGVLMVPRQVVEDSGMTPEQFADEWTRFNGVIFYNAKPGVPMPQQIASNSTQLGIGELLNIQLKFFEDISGVHGALQGREAVSGTSGTLYAQQQQNAATSLMDLLESFSQFVVDAAYKDVKNMQQFYDEKRVFNIAGKNATIVYDPKKLRDVEFDHSIKESQSTPAYRQIANDFILRIWESGQIPLEMMLEAGDFPFGDELLSLIRSYKDKMQDGTAEGLDPQLMQQAQQGVNMNAVNMAQQALRGAA